MSCDCHMVFVEGGVTVKVYLHSEKLFTESVCMEGEYDFLFKIVLIGNYYCVLKASLENNYK